MPNLKLELYFEGESVLAFAREIAKILVAQLGDMRFNGQTARLLTTEEAALELGVSPSFLKRRTSPKWQAGNGAFPHTKIGKNVRFSVQNLEEIKKMKS